jgi:uncharacterized protein with gpF-like domain
VAQTPKTLTPVRPNAGTEAAYRKAIDRQVRDMQASVEYWLRASYRANPPELAHDASPAIELRNAVRRLARRWQRNFDALAPKMAAYFATAVSNRSAHSMRATMRKAGWTVPFKPTRAMNDAYQATIAENVGLIKSIPSEYFTQVEGLVMRSVQQGQDLSHLTDELEKRYGITRRRAAFIARDQNDKATATFTRVRQIEAGVTHAIWVHSAGGRVPRPSHVAFSGERYDIRRGALIDGARIWPGELPNCRCVSRPCIPGFS